MADALQLKNEKQLLTRYYAGAQMESPNGGFLMPLGIRARDDGSAIAMFECSASSLRYELTIPKGSRGERKTVKDVMASGAEPDCPRHGPEFRLARAGKNLVCVSCGIAYGRV